VTTSQRAILAPLLGLALGWSFFMFAAWSNLFIQPVYDASGFVSEGPSIRPSTYLYLAGIAVFSVGAFIGLSLARSQRARSEPEDPLNLAAYRFGSLSVIIALAGGAIFAIGNFLTALGNRAEESLAARIGGVYLPIVLATALVVTLLLASFVRRSAESESSAAEDNSRTLRQKALGWGYALPILAAAIAVIFGLIVYDVTGTSLEGWVWVIIQVIIASGIILGTRYARRARAEKPPAPRPRTAWASGAWNLNFVLSIVFGAVVSIMAFVFGAEAFEQLRNYNFDYEGWEVEPFSLSWLLGDFSPALVLMVLVVVGLYATITERHRTDNA
jgi:magnesium-transporting ATPase (P-type)